jgi:predicted dithiol-disulfide oxidoreductase (DUF899 family)
MRNDGSRDIKGHPVVSRDQWLSARTAFLAKEKEFTRLRDDLSRQRRELPWVKIDKPYAFEGPNGKESLAGLFADRSQLLVYHFMFDPTWDAGCKSCSFWADNFDGIDVHLNHRDATFLAISRAPYDKLRAYRQRMGWSFKWVSSYGSDFNYDFQVSFPPEEVAKGSVHYNYTMNKAYGPEAVGVSVFYKDEAGQVFHTYSCYSRGVDMVNGAYHYVDLLPKGRDELAQGPQNWVRRHDEYKD